METPKHSMLLPWLLATLYNLMVEPYCAREHILMSLNREKPIRSFTIRVHCIENYSVHYQRRKADINPATKPMIYSSDWPVRNTGATVAQTLWKSPTSF